MMRRVAANCCRCRDSGRAARGDPGARHRRGMGRTGLAETTQAKGKVQHKDSPPQAQND